MTEAVSGDEALQLLTEQAFHLILLDIMVNKAGLAYNPSQTIWGVGYRFYHPGVMKVRQLLLWVGISGFIIAAGCSFMLSLKMSQPLINMERATRD